MSLYHYTDAGAVHSILTGTPTLWASQIKFMNDSNELNEGINFISKHLSQLVMESLDGETLIKIVSDNIEKKLIEDGKSLKDKRSFIEVVEREMIKDRQQKADKVVSGLMKNAISALDIYVCSFCEEPDLLSQWRGYANGTTGYCIEFDKNVLVQKVNWQKKFKNGLLSEHKEYVLEKAVYSTEDKEKLINDRAEDLNIMRGNIASLKRVIVSIGSLMKNESFSEEKEYRLVLQPNLTHNNTKFRTRNGVLIPYYEYLLPPESIKSITVGPSDNQELAAEGMKKFLDTTWIDKDNIPLVKTSKIPLRA